MKYLLLAYTDESKWNALSPAEQAALQAEARPQAEEVQRSGHVLDVGCLQPVAAAVSLRPRDGKTSITDGPYMETKEQIGAFMIIEARDLNEAVRIAASTPGARMGERVGWGMEVRPIQEMPKG